MKKFPKMLFVKREHDDTTDYFVPHENVLDAATLGEKMKVGVYKLIGTQEIEGVVSTRHMQKA